MFAPFLQRPAGRGGSWLISPSQSWRLLIPKKFSPMLQCTGRCVAVVVCRIPPYLPEHTAQPDMHVAVCLHHCQPATHMLASRGRCHRAAGYSVTVGCGLQAGITSGALASAAVGAINVLGTVIAASLMDKAGRKQLLTTSFAGARKSSYT